MKSIKLIGSVNSNDVSFFEVLDSDFVLAVYHNNITSWMVLDRKSFSFVKTVEFSDIFDELPPKAQEEFLYHFDILA